MRDPTVNATAAAEAKRVSDAIEFAKEHLYWTLVSDRRSADSRWSGQSPKVEWERGFHDALKIAREKENDPVIAAALEQACQRPREKGVLREQTNALRNQYIAEAVALTCRDGTISPTRNKDAKGNRRESGCSIVAEALRQLRLELGEEASRPFGLKLRETSVADIWAKHGQAYHHLLPR
jgi:hypothetical protein